MIVVMVAMKIFMVYVLQTANQQLVQNFVVYIQIVAYDLLIYVMNVSKYRDKSLMTCNVII